MRQPAERLRDVLDAIAAIERHLEHGTLDEGLVFDAVRMRLVEIGEAVKALDPAVLATEPGIPWRDVGRTRDWLAHRYFDTARAVLDATVRDDLPALRAAATRLLARLGA